MWRPTISRRPSVLTAAAAAAVATTETIRSVSRTLRYVASGQREGRSLSKGVGREGVHPLVDVA